MKIDFKKESLFEHFELSTKTTRVELNRQFQIKPNLRKELPHYIQILNSDQKLFIEELFNTYLDGKFCTIENIVEDATLLESRLYALAVFVNLIRRFDEVVSKIKISGKIFDQIIDCVFANVTASDFNFGKCTNAEELIKDFLDCCLSEMELGISSIINSVDSKSVNSLFRVLSAISNNDVKNRVISAFYNALSNTFETLTLRKDDKKMITTSINFLSGLTDSIFKKKEIYPAYKFCCNKLMDSDISSDKVFKLAKRLKDNDLKPIIENFINTSFKYILFENINNYEYDEIVKQGELAENLLSLANENSLNIENLKILNILVAFKQNGSVWYEKYQAKVSLIILKSDLSSAIYEVCCMVYRDKDLRANSVLFANMILRSANFDVRLDSFFGFLNRVEQGIEREYGYDDTIKIALMRKAIMDKQTEMLRIIMDFYAITIISPELVETFDSIYMLLVENVDKALNRMKKCDNIRGAYINHKNALQDMNHSNSYSGGSYSYGRSYSSGCYIATCVYGSYDCPQVWILRRYRDEKLGSSWFGKIFIKIYYAISPTLVKIFGKTRWFKKIWKKYLDKKVQKLKDSGYESTPYMDKNWR
jgi:hypothetical protein